MERISAAGRFGRRRGLVIFLLPLLLIAGAVSGQEADPAWARAFDPDPIRENSRFTMEFILDWSDPSRVSVTEPPLPAGITLLGGPDISVLREAGFGDLIREKTRIIYVFRSGEAGWRELGSYGIRVGDRQIATDPVLLPVTTRENGAIPHDVNWSVSREAIYRGQTIPLVLQMENVQEIMFPDRIKVTAPGNGVFEEVTGIGSIETRQVGGEVLYRVPVSAYLFTPNAAGRADVPPAQVTARGVTRTSAPLRLTVLPLPEEVMSTGAVGRFSVTSRIDRETAATGEHVHLTVRVEGEGNLSFLEIPEPVAEGLRPADRKEETSTIPSPRGLLGFREVHYTFLPDEPGSFRIEVPAFPWLDPESGAVRSIAPQGYRLEVVSADSGRKQLASGIPFEPLDAERALAARPADRYRRPVSYLFFLPGPLIFLAVLIRKGNRRKRLLVMIALLPLLLSAGPLDGELLESLRDAGRLYREGNYPQALEEYRAVEKKLPENPAVQRDLGLAAYAAHRYGEAIHALRRALWLRPDRDTRELLSRVEAELGLEKQVPRSAGGHPDPYFLLLAGSWNVSWLLFALLLSFRNGKLVILCLLGAGLTLGAAGLLVRSLAALSLDTGVVLDGVYLKKIPLDEAVDWVELTAGTAVRIRAESGDYLLVQTGYGIEGWMPDDAVHWE